MSNGTTVLLAVVIAAVVIAVIAMIVRARSKKSAGSSMGLPDLGALSASGGESKQPKSEDLTATTSPEADSTPVGRG